MENVHHIHLHTALEGVVDIYVIIYYRHIWGVWDNEYGDCVVNICDDDLHSSVVRDVHVKGSGRATTLRNKKKFVKKIVI